jgi:formate hydrogenlyase subunit 4
MIHEAMLLEYSGRHLALLEFAGALRLTLWLTLIGTLFDPAGIAPAGAGPLAWVIGLTAWATKLLLFVGGVSAMEMCVARMRLFRVPEFLGLAVLLGLRVSACWPMTPRTCSIPARWCCRFCCSRNAACPM